MKRISIAFVFFTILALFASCDNSGGYFGEGDGMNEDSVLDTVKTKIVNVIKISLPDRLLAASVTVYVYNKEKKIMQSGSGVFVKDNIIATNFHVIDGGYYFRILRNLEENKIDAQLYKFDKNHDVALLKIEQSFPNNVLDLTNKLPGVGIEIWVAGSPVGLTGSLSNGIVSSIRKNLPYDFDLIQITAPISPGSSGGPVVNMAGEIIGIVVSNIGGDHTQGLNFAVPAKYVDFLLQ